MENFEYHRPAKLADAVKLLKSKKDMLVKFLDGVGKLQALVVHHETDGRTVRAAAKAVIELFLGADGE